VDKGVAISVVGSANDPESFHGTHTIFASIRLWGNVTHQGRAQIFSSPVVFSRAVKWLPSRWLNQTGGIACGNGHSIGETLTSDEAISYAQHKLLKFQSWGFCSMKNSNNKRLTQAFPGLGRAFWCNRSVSAWLIQIATGRQLRSSKFLEHWPAMTVLYVGNFMYIFYLLPVVLAHVPSSPFRGCVMYSYYFLYWNNILVVFAFIFAIMFITHLWKITHGRARWLQRLITQTLSWKQTK
jgi:hypothetical protein